MTKLTASLLAALLLLATPAVARSIRLDRFDAEILVERDGSLLVSETLQLRFEGSWNGIVRSIPVRYRSPGGLTYALLLDVVGVADDSGARLRREISRSGRNLEVKIWVPGAADAVRTIVLRYRVENGLRFFDTHDELYWNVTGTEWEFPIGSASATVQLPEGVTGVRANAFTGPYGSRGRDAAVEDDASTVRVWTNRELGYREGLTAVIGWDRGVVAAPGALRRASWFLRGNWPLGLPIAVFAGMYALWSRRGRDPRLRPVVARYEPPAELSPAEVGTLVDHKPDLRDVTATIVDLAVRSHLEIEEESTSKVLGLLSERDYRFRRRAPETGAGVLRRHEERILRALFRFGDDIRLSDLEHEFYKDLPEIRDRIFEPLLAKRFYDHRPDRSRRAAFVAAGVIGGISLVASELLASWLGIEPFTVILALVLSGAVVAAFGWFLPARTARGARVLEEVLGFQEFLDRVEADRLERVPPTPETFERYLPYAMALGVERNWARAFDDILKEPPRWYHGGEPGRGFRCRSFVDDLGRMSTRAATVLASAPRSSGGSGFGGGGFSGGGFGGGGGRGF